MTRDRWLGVELRHFAALAAVAEERSFHGAGARLGYVQSAISRQIAHLERLTGARLIERARGPKPVYLTESGEMLLEHANEILAIIDAAKSELDARDVGSGEEVRVGLFAGVPTRVLAAALPVFAKRHPGVRVSATEAVSDGPLLDLLRQGRVDVAIAHLPIERGPFAACELLRIPWAVVLPAGARLATRSATPTLAQVARLPLIGFTSPRLEPWNDACWPPDVQPQIVFRCDAAHTAQALVGAGVGAALMPRLAVNETDPRTTVIQLDDALTPVTIGLVWLRHRPLAPGMLQFRDLVRGVCAKIGQQPPATRRFERGHTPAAVAAGQLRAERV